MRMEKGGKETATRENVNLSSRMWTILSQEGVWLRYTLGVLCAKYRVTEQSGRISNPQPNTS